MARLLKQDGGAILKQDGGAILTAISLLTFMIAGTGGATTTGSAQIATVKPWTGTGGGITGGAASLSVIHTNTALGGATGSSAALMAFVGVPVSTGGAKATGSAGISAAYTNTPTGGAISGGSASMAKILAATGGGGATGGGSASIARVCSTQSTGGATTGGTAAFAFVRAFTGTGGGVSSGSSPLAFVRAFVGTGGGVYGGVASVISIKNVSATGGATATGTAPNCLIQTPVTGGGATASGNALTAFVAVNTGMGGATASGISSTSFVRTFTGTGGATAGGAAQPGMLYVLRRTPTKLLQQNGGRLLTENGSLLWNWMGTFIEDLGIRAGGAAIIQIPYNCVPTGGATAGGAAVVSFVRSIAGTGGATATASNTLSIATGGGATAGGTALFNYVYSHTTTGGATASGKAIAMSTNDFKFQFFVGGPGFALDDLLIARRTDYDAAALKNVVYEVQGRVTGVSREGEATISIYKGKEHLSRFGKNIEFTRFGNFSNPARQGSISIISDDTATNEFDKLGNTPCIDIRGGVNSDAMAKDVATLKARIGKLDGIVDPRFGAYQPEGFGIYTENFYGTGRFILGEGSTGFGMLDDRPKSLADLDPTAAAAIGSIPTWDSMKPAFFDEAPEANGLFLSSTHFGYFRDGAWRTYMDTNGDFYLKGATGESFLEWDASSETLHVRGEFEAMDNATSYWGTRVTTDAFGLHVATQVFGGTTSQFGVSCDVFSNNITWKANYGLGDDCVEYFAASIGIQQTETEDGNDSVMTIDVPNVAVTGSVIADNIQGNAVINDTTSKIRATNGLLYSFNGTTWTVTT